jgi:DNA-binding NarL/FixJ family response regulator
MSMLTDAEEMNVAEQHLVLLHAFADGSDSTEVAQKLGISTRTVRNYKRNAVIAVQEAYSEVEDV